MQLCPIHRVNPDLAILAVSLLLLIILLTIIILLINIITIIIPIIAIITIIAIVIITGSDTNSLFQSISDNSTKGIDVQQTNLPGCRTNPKERK